nr:MAG TPA: hypothetical protein [Caudoviricetes sp.]
MTAGTTSRTRRGGQNLYSKPSVERAWGLTRKVALSNGVYRP